MRALILTEGGYNIGFGHVSRCLGLYEAFSEGAVSADMLIWGDDSLSKLIDGFSCRFYNWQHDLPGLFDLAKKYDVIVIDSYLAPLEVYYRLSEISGGNLIMLDDYGRLDYPDGIVVNPSIYGDNTAYPAKKEIDCFLGKNYIILRKSFWRPAQKEINKDIKKFLITFGGIPRKGFISDLIGRIGETFPFSLEVIDPCKSTAGTDRVLSEMLTSDICLSGGGQTLHETARIGLPTIAVGFADNQKFNLRSWSKAGFIEYAGSYEDDSLLASILKAVRKLLPYKERCRRSVLGRGLVDGQGARRIVQAAINRIINFPDSDSIYLRQAIIEDCRLLWEWRNHPDVRKWCFNKNPIPYEQHEKWFTGMLDSRSTVIYIAENEKKQKLGQVRFDLQKDQTSLININLNHKFIGQGLGGKIISSSSRLFLFFNPDIRVIRAEILSSNYSSIKAFKKAGYTFLNKDFKDNDTPVDIFIFNNSYV